MRGLVPSPLRLIWIAACFKGYLQKEDVSTLHAWVEDLSCTEVITLLAAHDLCTLLDPIQIEATGNVQHQRIVFMRIAVYFLTGI